MVHESYRATDAKAMTGQADLAPTIAVQKAPAGIDSGLMPIHAPPTRAATLKRLSQHRFDVLVIGGGINGAGIARDAARRGLDVALLERGDFASGTSSRSSRLVHGGVRYLEHGHVRLVFEASRERRTLLRIAPHLVRPLRFIWPVYAGARIPRWKLLAGLWLYDLLALFRNVGRHQARSASEITALEPALATQALRGGATYFDAATDDARLTIATLLDAARAGATVLNHADVTALRLVDGIAAGATATDRRGGGTFDVSADCVVSATGPWTDAIRALESPGAPASVHGTKGVHIAVPRQRVGNREAITLLAPDGRVMFALPAGPCTILGTTDTVTRESPDDVCASVADIEYLLAAANRFFPNAALTTGDVISAWAGIRPLIAGPADRAPASASREHAIAVGPRGVITVTGGKLTTYRVVAADAVDAVLRRLGRRASGSHTDHLPLPGGTIGSVDAERIAAHAATRDTAVGDRLVRAYGAEWRDVWALVGVDAALAARLDPTLPYIGAEVHHAVAREFACTIADVLVRRVPLAFETRDHGASAAPRVAAIMAPLHGWTDRGIADALAEYHAEVTRLFRIAR